MASARMICIGEVVGKYFNMDKRTMDLKTNKREISKVRQFAQHFAYEYKVASLSKIGAYFGSTSHSTVLHSHKTILNGIETDKMEKAAHESINKMIKARFKTDLSSNNKISELDMVKAVKRGLNDVNSRIMFNLLLKEQSNNKLNKPKINSKIEKPPMLLQLLDNKVVRRFESQQQAARELKINQGRLSEILSGAGQNIVGYEKYKFTYQNEELK